MRHRAGGDRCATNAGLANTGMASRWNHVVRLGPAVENGCVVLASVNGRTYELYKCVDCTQMRFARFDGSGWDKARPLAIASPKYAIANQQGRVSLDPPVSIPLGATSGGPVYKKEIGYMEFHHLLGADDGQNIGFQLLAKRHVEEVRVRATGGARRRLTRTRPTGLMHLKPGWIARSRH